MTHPEHHQTGPATVGGAEPVCEHPHRKQASLHVNAPDHPSPRPRQGRHHLAGWRINVRHMLPGRYPTGGKRRIVEDADLYALIVRKSAERGGRWL